MAQTAAAPRPAPRAIPVRELVARIQLALYEGFPGRLWVEGELSNFRTGRNGHAFCVLKDEEAQVEAVIWSSNLAALRFAPADGMQVLALVRKVDFYAPQGRLRVHLERIEPVGTGALYRALEERRQRLAAEGLFDEARKRPLPFLPRAVGIVTATGGAVIHDMLRILAQRFAERRVLVRPCKVQGEGAADDIAAALDDLNRDGTVDVIVVGRGGGSAEDLWAFNEESVVRAIARSQAPVISAVGHETDWTLADLAADLRVATPTAAAQRVMPERAVLEAELVARARRMREALDGRVVLARTRLEARRAELGDPRRRVVEMGLRLEALGARAIEALRARLPRLRARLTQAETGIRRGTPDAARRRSELERLGGRLTAAVGRPLEAAQRGLAERAAQIEALSPLKVLGRGFALARRADGAVVRDAAVLVPGEELGLRFARGAARVGVLGVSVDDTGSGEQAVRADPPSAARPGRRPRRA